MTIKAVLVLNDKGKARLSKFYTPLTEDQQARIIRECFGLISQRSEAVCSFLEGTGTLWGKDTKLVYRYAAPFYIAFVVDGAESELGILDLIQLFMKLLNSCFGKAVSELDVVFHIDKVHYILDELVMGGMMLETTEAEVLAALEAQEKLEHATTIKSSFSSFRLFQSSSTTSLGKAGASGGHK